LSTEEQLRVFSRAHPNSRKVIAATNIAEVCILFDPIVEPSFSHISLGKRYDRWSEICSGLWLCQGMFRLSKTNIAAHIVLDKVLQPIFSPLFSFYCSCFFGIGDTESWSCWSHIAWNLL